MVKSRHCAYRVFGDEAALAPLSDVLFDLTLALPSASASASDEPLAAGAAGAPLSIFWVFSCVLSDSGSAACPVVSGALC